jgi:hypothetical protein
MKIALSLAAAALVLAPAAPAHAGPLDDNCISWLEFKNMTRDNMRDLERAVDATGSIVSTQQQGQFMLKQYRWCGLYANEGFFQIFYARNKAGQYMSQYISAFDFRSKRGPLQHQPA